jgi:hypothetical protein
MPQLTETPSHMQPARADWAARESALLDQLAEWATAQGWRVDRGTERMDQRQFGTYEGAALVLHPPGGEVAVTPFPPGSGGGGSVVIQAMPTFSRVRLKARPDDWEVIVNANIR